MISEVNMAQHHQAMLEFLRRHLQFLEGGGYRRCSRPPWCAPYSHEQDPCCINSLESLRSDCDTCWLMEFIDPEYQKELVPCRFVQLTPSGVTLDYLSRYGTPLQTEETLRNWLLQRIYEIESEMREEKVLRDKS